MVKNTVKGTVKRFCRQNTVKSTVKSMIKSTVKRFCRQNMVKSTVKSAVQGFCRSIASIAFDCTLDHTLDSIPDYHTFHQPNIDSV